MRHHVLLSGGAAGSPFIGVEHLVVFGGGVVLGVSAWYELPYLGRVRPGDRPVAWQREQTDEGVVEPSGLRSRG